MKYNILIFLLLSCSLIYCGSETDTVENIDKYRKENPNILNLEEFNDFEKDPNSFSKVSSSEIAKNDAQIFYDKSLIADTQDIAFFTGRRSNVILKNTGLNPVDISFVGIVDDPSNPLSQNSAEKFEISWKESEYSLSPGKDLKIDIEYIHPSEDLAIAYLVVVSNAENNQQIVVTLTVKCVGPDCRP